jgi:hypothetical protein
MLLLRQRCAHLPDGLDLQAFEGRLIESLARFGREFDAT